MADFNYFKVNRVYNELYYQFPKVFFVSETYRKMSDSTKLAYMLLKARLQSAIVKEQIDENGNVFFTYTTTELCKVLNCQKQKALKIKKDLESFGLLLQTNMGFNKKLGKHNANRLYLAELEVTENDIYLLDKFDTNNFDNTDKSEGMKIIPSTKNKKNTQSQAIQEGMEIIPSENVDNPKGMKITPVLNNNKLDTNRHNKDTTKELMQDQLLLDGFVELMHDPSIATFISEKVLNLIQVYSKTFLDAQTTVKTIHNAKRQVEKDHGINIVYEHIGDLNGKTADALMYTTLLKAYQKQKTEKVNNIQNLIFVYMRNFFEEQVVPKFLQED